MRGSAPLPDKMGETELKPQSQQLEEGMAEVPNVKEDIVNDKRSNWQAAQARFSALKPFVIISLSYLLYTMTDGAIR